MFDARLQREWGRGPCGDVEEDEDGGGDGGAGEVDTALS